METDLLRERLEQLQSALRSASDGRYPPPRIIAVTKNHPADMILPLSMLGVREIGENRVQEIREKIPLLEGKFDLHLIGRLQTNKVKYIMKDVVMIQSLDRSELAHEINRHALKLDKVMPVLVQVSPAGEEQKGGIAPEQLRPFLREIAVLPGLHVRGLMAVMPNLGPCPELEALFGNMRTLFEQIRDEAIPGIDMDELSMGMSGDYLYAARHGATMVRIGSALFGPRNYGPI
ncbi:MAG: YggS family pyridoxal phosphate-dependent enzyme [Clostridiales bacterium]|nr:YggS family pyridoxal phosphate-dependent enzyme [Clostridia bacterium]MCR4882589.1 YggS family pyridoxal phosphate-dependent enzyme [Clostridiales bacterium]